MTSCSFVLWLNQTNVQAANDDTTAQITTTVDQSNAQTVTVNGQSVQNSNTATGESYNENDQGNYACLDSGQLDAAGNLTVSGWHATNAAQSRPYHYVIAYDKTNNREIGRVNVTNSKVERADVQRVHNVYGAGQSGFTAKFNLATKLANLNQLQIISRYTDDAAGNGNAADYWFRPITINQSNLAHIDSTNMTNDQLVVTGWHATNLAIDKPYHVIILFDQTLNHEVARVNVKQSERPDVARTFPGIAGASQSGFTARFNVKKIDFSHQLQIISRYSSNAAANSDYVDYWFAPLSIDRDNLAHIDQVTVANNQLVINGWHATNLATNKPYHVVILFDRTLGHEIARVDAGQYSRPDVAKAFPDMAVAGQSGFTAKFDLHKVNFSHQLQIISRYSDNAAANSDYIDYWFPLLTKGHEVNQGYLDNYDFSDGKNLKVSGWHASGLSQFENNHFIILFDTTANSQVAVDRVTPTSRPDIAKFFPNVFGAGQAGFNTSFDLAKLQLNHTYAIVSRYSTSNQGNGDQGQYTDLWMHPFTFNEQGKEHYLESLKMTANGLRVSGWLIDGQAKEKPYAYVIVLNDGREVGRQKLNLHQRTDISRLYPHVYNSLNSGFNELVSFDPSKITGSMSIILRYTDDPAGNGDFSDQYSDNYRSNDGHFDQVNVTANSIYVAGWHASDQSAGKPYQWLIFLDQNGHELYRQQVLDINRSRSDVEKWEPYILNSANSGFQLGFTIPSQLQNHVVNIIHRFTDDPAGNGHYADIYSGWVSVNAYSQRLLSSWQQIINRFNTPVAIAVQMADTGEVISYSNVPGRTFIMASTVKVGILAKLFHNQNGNLSASQMATATRMIEFSDNNCASELYNEIGGMSGLNQLFQELGMSSTYCSGRWGLTTTTPVDQLKLLHEVFLNPGSTYLNQQSQQYIQNLMANVTASQAWGISSGSNHFYIKDGWNETDQWNVSSIGDIPGKYTIAVYVKNPSYNYCRSLIEQLGAATRQIVG